MGRELNRFIGFEEKFDSKLVNLVKQCPHLFDPSHKLFEDENARIESWQYIGQILGQSSYYCEKRWLSIKTRLFEEVVWMKTYMVTFSLWLLYPQVEFLLEFMGWDDLQIIEAEEIEWNDIELIDDGVFS